MPVKVRWCLTDEPLTRLFNARFAVDAASAPDFVIHAANDDTCLDYPDAVRICLSLSGPIPDYNLSDYGISPASIALGDRHLNCGRHDDSAIWLDFLTDVFARAKADAFRRDRDYWGRFYERARALLTGAPQQLAAAEAQQASFEQTLAQMTRIANARQEDGAHGKA